MSSISALALFVSVGSLQSVGIWLFVALLLGLCSLAVLFFTCARLGYFYQAPGKRRGGTNPPAR